uniref:Uncharacterized protein n=1 Tax=Chlamydomonas leiostraca TaxID=1034604 RepID=A0A7S0WV64_9CHLO
MVMGNMGPYGGMVGMGGPMGMMGGGENAHAYFAWTHDQRQKVLEKWFAEDHAKKVRGLEEQKVKIEHQVALKKAEFDARLEMRKVETGLASLARQVERNAYELTGQPPVAVLTMDQLTARVGAALGEAVAITRKKALLEDALGGNMASYRPPPDFPSLMAALTSPDWLHRMSLPANLETLRLALEVRKTASELERVRALEAHDSAWAARQADAGNARLVHAMNVQASALQAALQAQAAELGSRLVADAHAAAASASFAAAQVSGAAAHVAAASSLLPGSLHSPAHSSPARSRSPAPAVGPGSPHSDGSSRPDLVGTATAAAAAGVLPTMPLPGAPPSPLLGGYYMTPGGRIHSPDPATAAHQHQTGGSDGSSAAGSNHGGGGVSGLGSSFLTSLFPHTPKPGDAAGAASAAAGAGGSPASVHQAAPAYTAATYNGGSGTTGTASSVTAAGMGGVVGGGYGYGGSPPSPRGSRLSPHTWQMEPSDEYVTVSGSLAASFAAAPGTSPLPVVPSPTSD